MSVRVALIVAAAVALSGCPRADDGPAVIVERGWVRAPVPGTSMTAAYLTIENRSDRPIVIDGATSSEFADVTLHSTQMVDGRMQMRPIEGLTVPAGTRAVLAPGGDHLMLAGPRLAPESLQTLSLTLSENGAPLVTVTLPVSRSDPWEDN